MQEETDREVVVGRKCLSVAVVTFAIVGLCVVVQWCYAAYRSPHVVARPISFLIVEIRRTRDSSTPRARIFLDNVTDPAKVRFEGAGLNWEHAKLAYPRATVPSDGF